MNKEIKLVVKVNDPQKEASEKDFLAAPDSFFTRIVVQDVLELSTNVDILTTVSNKLRKGGTLVVEGVDALDLCRRIYNGSVSLEEASRNFLTRSHNLNAVATLRTFFAKREWPIKFAGLLEGRYFVEVVRP